jgi:hypothetical protein
LRTSNAHNSGLASSCRCWPCGHGRWAWRAPTSPLTGSFRWPLNSYRAGKELWAKVPRFEFRASPVVASLRENLISLGVLAGGLLMATPFAAWAASKRKP